MKTKLHLALTAVLTILVLAVTLPGCGRISAASTRAAEESSLVLGGGGSGGVMLSNGQFVEGLVVVGSGTASAEPEAAQITFGVELRGDDPAALVDEAALKIERAIAVVEGLGVGSDDIRTTSYSLWVESVYDPERGVPTGEVIYHVNHHIQVVLRDLDQVGDLLAGVVEAGANSISGVSFTVDDPQALVREARQKALQDAAAQAEQMADGLDIALGKPILVTETGGGYTTPVEWGSGGGGGMGESVAPSISPAAFSVAISVQVAYEIK